MRFSDLPISQKLTALLLLTSLMVMVLMMASFLGYEYLTFRREAVRELSVISDIVAANSTAALAFDNQVDAIETLDSLRAERHITAAALYDENGYLFASYPADATGTTLPPRPRAEGHAFDDGRLGGFRAVTQLGRPLGTLYVEFDTASMLSEWYRASLKIAVAVLIVSVLAAVAISRLLQKRISRPILSLAETAEAISRGGDISVRAVKQSNDELGLLTDAFNQMLDEIHELHSTLEQRVAERTYQLELANKELESFSYSVSHDLRAPLRSINGFSQILLEECGDRLDDSGKHHLKRVRDAADRMGQLIDDLLNLSRYSRAEMQRQNVDLSGLAAVIAQELRQRAPERQVEFAIEDSVRVEGDGRLLRVVLENLIGNAWKFSSGCSVSRIEFGRTSDQGEPAIFVKDNGAGFDMAYAQKLFGPFQRLHATHEFEGTGIGLATVARIIHRHGGKVWAEAEPGAGATFYFTV